MVNRLETDREYYSAEVKKADLESKDIQENRERLAREQYYMKRPDEDVFIIVEE
jgi:cell division protein FtsB